MTSKTMCANFMCLSISTTSYPIFHSSIEGSKEILTIAGAHKSHSIEQAKDIHQASNFIQNERQSSTKYTS
jgi:hypothetical protein